MLMQSILFILLACLLLQIYLTKCSEYRDHMRHSYPSFPQCVIIPFRLRIMGSQKTVIPLCFFQEIISIFCILRCRREREKGTKSTQIFTFQTCRRTPIQCIPSPKTSKQSRLRLEVSFGFSRHSQQVLMLELRDTLRCFYLIHPAISKSRWCQRVIRVAIQLYLIIIPFLT